MRHFDGGERLGPGGGGVPHPFPGGGHHGGFDGGWWILGGVLWLVVLAAVVVAAVVIADKLLARSRQAAPAGTGAAPVAPGRVDDALGVLRARYARGEIGRDDYLRAAADLAAPTEPPAP